MSNRFTSSLFFQEKIHPVLARLPLYDYWLLRRKSYLRDVGWFKSFRTGKNVDAQLNPIPWFTYSAIHLINDRLPEDATVFEFGSGLGTGWWADKARKVDSVEHNSEWVKKIKPLLPDHVEILFRELDNGYETAAGEKGTLYDVIIIDGRNRVQCCYNSIRSLSDRGIVIFDDSNRGKYQAAIQMLKKGGFKQLPLRGFSPIDFLGCETSIFYREGNLLNL
ncbi:MAG: hypothetical protein WEA56_07940 [Balneolaceae bacterium]